MLLRTERIHRRTDRAYGDNEVPDFARVLRERRAGISLVSVFFFSKVGNGRDGWISVGKRERRMEDFYSVLMGNLTTASTNNGVQHETTRI